MPDLVKPWPVAPRPFFEEAFGSWLGRVATCYQISVSMLWETSTGSALQVGADERGEVGSDPDATRMDGRPALPCLLFQMSRAQRCRRVGPTVEEGMA